MAVRYTQEQKDEAMRSIEKVGVAKTSEEMKIAVQTLYKWRNDSNATKPPEKSAGISGAGDLYTSILSINELGSISNENALLSASLEGVAALLSHTLL